MRKWMTCFGLGMLLSALAVGGAYASPDMERLCAGAELKLSKFLVSGLAQEDPEAGGLFYFTRVERGTELKAAKRLTDELTTPQDENGGHFCKKPLKLTSFQEGKSVCVYYEPDKPKDLGRVDMMQARLLCFHRASLRSTHWEAYATLSVPARYTMWRKHDDKAIGEFVDKVRKQGWKCLKTGDSKACKLGVTSTLDVTKYR
jgi:hypothetical protein